MVEAPDLQSGEQAFRPAEREVAHKWASALVRALWVCNARRRAENKIPLSLNRVINHVQPAKNPVKDHPQNGMIDAPGNGYGQDTSEAPATYAR